MFASHHSAGLLALFHSQKILIYLSDFTFTQQLIKWFYNNIVFPFLQSLWFCLERRSCSGVNCGEGSRCTKWAEMICHITSLCNASQDTLQHCPSNTPAAAQQLQTKQYTNTSHLTTRHNEKPTYHNNLLLHMILDNDESQSQNNSSKP